MILRTVIALLGALWLAGCSAADETARDWPAPSPAIWEMTAPDGGKGWLFGTIHALPDSVEWRTEAIDSAFAEAGLLVVEIADLDDTQAAFDAFRARAYDDTLPPLLDRVGPDRRKAVAEMIERADGDPDDYAQMKTWAAAMTLTSGLRTGNPDNGVDRALLASGKPVLAFESYEAQYDLFDSLSRSDQSDLLAATAMEARENKSPVLTEAWLTGDVELFDEHANEGMLAYPVLRQALLVDRNAAWSARIAELVSDGHEPFVAVGAAHVTGTYGLIAMLEEEGFAFNRLQ